MKKYRIEQCTNGWIVYILFQSGSNETVRGRYVFHRIEDATNLIVDDQKGQGELGPPF